MCEDIKSTFPKLGKEAILFVLIILWLMTVFPFLIRSFIYSISAS